MSPNDFETLLNCVAIIAALVCVISVVADFFLF